MSLFGDIIGGISSSKAAQNIAVGNQNAEQGVLNATKSATTGIQSQLGKAYNDVGAAGANVNTATGTANNQLQSILEGIQGNLAPGIQSGIQGNTSLQDYVAKNPTFSFDPAKYLNSDAMKFQQKEGSEGITNAASAMGLGASGNTLKSLDKYNQDVASTYYNQAETQAQNEFALNQNTTLANLKALIDSGNTSNVLNQTASATFGAPQADNTIKASTTNAGLQQFLAQLGLQGQEASGAFSMSGAKTAGDFAVGVGNANAAKNLSNGVALTSGASDLGSLINGFLPGGGGR